MMDFEYFELEEVIAFHSKIIKKYGGLRGLRNQGLLISAIESPKMQFSGNELYPDVYSKAACYLYGIVKNHPFIDGNKRTGSFVSYLFLKKHGVKKIPLDTFEELVVRLADGKVEREEIALFFKEKNEFF